MFFSSSAELASQIFLPVALRVLKAASCSSLLSRKFNEEVEAGWHVKPASHRSELGRWKLFVENDGPVLTRLHQDIHDRRNGVSPGQSRLAFRQ
jgi:hypothetical protein